MTGSIHFWNPRQRWGRIKANLGQGNGSGQMFFFRQDWVALENRVRTFTRGQAVTFDGDTTRFHGKRRRVALRVALRH